MSLRIIDTAIATEQADELHQARLMLLLRHITDRGDGSVEGITKLAKLDFLLRYPLYLERLCNVLNVTRKRPIRVPKQAFEENTVESKMIRFRYGPWDSRYRRWIALLVSKNLAATYLKGRTVHVRLTDLGKDVAARLAGNPAFNDLDERAKLISRTVGSRSGEWLKTTIYDVVPELNGMAWGEDIAP
jgi:hypothetical protein